MNHRTARTAAAAGRTPAGPNMDDATRAQNPSETGRHPVPVPAAPPVPIPLPADAPAGFGGYRVVGVLGQGGMGTVYHAHDDRLGRAVAVKTMRPDFATRADAAARFLREARAAARIAHDHIVPIWQVGEDAGVPYIVMPLLAGETLADWLRREPVLSAAAVLKIGIEVAEGLAAAHAAGLVHRDVKPANVWIEAAIDRPFRCRLLDFGLARADGDDPHLTAVGAVMGTPAYMSPEQAAGRPVDARADLFSLGALLYHAATGAAPFAGPTAAATLANLETRTPAAPAAAANSGLPPGLSEMIARLVAKDPAGRPAAARDVAAALRAVATPPGHPAAATVTFAPAARRKSPGRRRPWVAAAFAVVAVVALGAVVIKIKSPNGTETTVEVPDGSKVKIDPRGAVTVELPAAAAVPPPAPRPARPFTPRRLADIFDPKTAAVAAADEFDNPDTSEFNWGGRRANFRGGRFVIDGIWQGSWGTSNHAFRDFACVLTGRVAVGRHRGWGLAVLREFHTNTPRAEIRGVDILLNSEGELVVVPCRFDVQKHADFPRVGPVRVVTFRPGEFNALAAVLQQKDRLSVFVNGTEACEPITLPYALDPANVQIASDGGTDAAARLELDSFHVYSTIDRRAGPKK